MNMASDLRFISETKSGPHRRMTRGVISRLFPLVCCLALTNAWTKCDVPDHVLLHFCSSKATVYFFQTRKRSKLRNQTPIEIHPQVCGIKTAHPLGMETVFPGLSVKSKQTKRKVDPSWPPRGDDWYRSVLLCQHHALTSIKCVPSWLRCIRLLYSMDYYTYTPSISCHSTVPGGGFRRIRRPATGVEPTRQGSAPTGQIVVSTPNEGITQSLRRTPQQEH